MCVRLSPKIIHNLGTPHKNVRQPSPMLKILKNIGLKGCQIISLPKVPTCLRPAMVTGVCHTLGAKELTKFHVYMKSGEQNLCQKYKTASKIRRKQRGWCWWQW
jgi:hypothetical protein